MILDFKETDLPVGYYWPGGLGPCGSAAILDFKPVKWKCSHKKGSRKILYFKGNFPRIIGQCGSKGESYIIREAGTGLMETLKKLEKGRVKKSIC